jgi:hypothetical protein
MVTLNAADIPSQQILAPNSTCSLGIVTGCEFEDGGVGVRVTVGQEFSLLHVVQTGSGVHPTSYTMGTGALSSGVKRSGREDDQSSPTIAEVRKKWIYTATSPYAFMA